MSKPENPQMPALLDSRALRAEVRRLRSLQGSHGRAEARANTLWADSHPRPHDATQVLSVATPATGLVAHNLPVCVMQ